MHRMMIISIETLKLCLNYTFLYIETSKSYYPFELFDLRSSSKNIVVPSKTIRHNKQDINPYYTHLLNCMKYID